MTVNIKALLSDCFSLVSSLCLSLGMLGTRHTLMRSNSSTTGMSSVTRCRNGTGSVL